MMRARWRSLAGMMFLILLTALAINALARPSRLWAAALFSGATALLTGAVILAACARGPRRAFWLGASIAGWGYLLLQYGPFCESRIGPHTVTTALLDIIHPLIARLTPTSPPVKLATTYLTAVMPPSTGSPATTSGSPGPTWAIVPGTGMPGGGPAPGISLRLGIATTPWDAWNALDTDNVSIIPTPAPFYRIGHSFLSVLAALAGGLLGAWTAKRETRPPAHGRKHEEPDAARGPNKQPALNASPAPVTPGD